MRILREKVLRILVEGLFDRRIQYPNEKTLGFGSKACGLHWGQKGSHSLR